MSLVLSGNAAHVSSPLTATIVGMADNGSGAIRVQTLASHFFASHDYVHIETIGTVVDSYFAITVIDATHFDLIGSTYTGTGTGTATDSSLTPAIQVPTDGDTASLQLSGMLSALQALADRTQYLAKSNTRSSIYTAFLSSDGNVVIPPWITHILAIGCGGGGGGGGGIGGSSGGGSPQYASGGGGAGANLGVVFVVKNSATSLDVVIGEGGSGGSGSVGGSPPSDALIGLKGFSTTVARHDGPAAGVVFAEFFGGSGGGFGSSEVAATSSLVPVYTPGGEPGPGGVRNSSCKQSRTAPGPKQLYNIDNNGGVLSVPGGAWAPRVYTDPVGQMGWGEGGASMANGGNASYLSGISYDGAPSTTGAAGGAAGSEGAPHTIYQGGVGGGGGGGGPFAPGGDGGDGGAAAAITGVNGTGGSTGGVVSGSGGGGGGGGGGALTTPGTGGTGGNGGKGAVRLVLFAMV